MNNFIETLESRSLLSAAPVGVVWDLSQTSAALVQPLATTVLPRLVGRFTGTVKIPGVFHIRAVTVTITKQTAAGAFTGTMIPTADTSIRIAVKGKVLAGHKFTISLNGSHSGGAIIGTGKGNISTNGKTLTTTTLSFRQGDRLFPGSMVLKKV